MIDIKNGQIILPLEINTQLNLQNGDWLKVSIKSGKIILTPEPEMDEELIKVLMHEGVLMI